MTCYSVDKSKNKQSYYRGKDCMERFSKDFKNLVIKAINHEKKESILLTNDEKKFMKNKKFLH